MKIRIETAREELSHLNEFDYGTSIWKKYHTVVYHVTKRIIFKILCVGCSGCE